MTDKKKFKISKKQKRISILCLVALLLFLFFHWQNNGLTVSRFQYASGKVPAAFDGYKIVQISDLHNKRFGDGQNRLLSAIRRENPDLIVVTGDLVDENKKEQTASLEFIAGALEIAPVYYVTGNHEYWMRADAREDFLKELTRRGVVCLQNEKAVISKGNAAFTLIGLDDAGLASLAQYVPNPTESTSDSDNPSSDNTGYDNTAGSGDDPSSDNTSGSDDISHPLTALAAGEEDRLTVLLAHEPQYLSAYSASGVDVVLSGHAHGGQFRLPFIGGLIAPDQGFFPKYTAGCYQEGNTCMYVSRGLGGSVIPVRLFNRPDILVLTLTRSDEN